MILSCCVSEMGNIFILSTYYFELEGLQEFFRYIIIIGLDVNLQILKSISHFCQFKSTMDFIFYTSHSFLEIIFLVYFSLVYILTLKIGSLNLIQFAPYTLKQISTFCIFTLSTKKEMGNRSQIS